MSGFASALAVDSDWQSCCTALLEGLAVPASANLGFLYCSDQHAGHVDDIVSRLRLETGVAHWIGSIGLGVSGVGQVEFDTPALSVMVGSFGDDQFRVFESTALTEETRAWAAAHEARFGIVHGDPHVTHLPGDIVSFASGLDSGFLVGGLSSARNEAKQIAERSLRGGLSGALFSDDTRLPPSSVRAVRQSAMCNASRVEMATSSQNSTGVRRSK